MTAEKCLIEIWFLSIHGVSVAKSRAADRIHDNIYIWILLGGRLKYRVNERYHGERYYVQYYYSRVGLDTCSKVRSVIFRSYGFYTHGHELAFSCFKLLRVVDIISLTRQIVYKVYFI